MECGSPSSMQRSTNSAGTGVAIVPTSLRQIRHGDVVYRPLRERPRAQLVMVSRKNATSPVLREFIDDVRRLGARGIRRGAHKASGAAKKPTETPAGRMSAHN